MKSKVLQWIGPVGVPAGVILYAVVKFFRPEFMTIIIYLFLAFFAWLGIMTWFRDRCDRARTTFETNYGDENDGDSKGDHSG